MAQSPTSFSRFAGVARFPRSARDLTSTEQCPACFTTLTAVVCSNCSLDLTSARAVELARVSQSAAALLDTRVELIGRIRFETDEARRADATAVEPAMVSVAVPLTASAPPAPPTPPAEPRATPAAAPRRSSVQVALLVVGVSLVSIAATFFLVYAFINYGIVWRSVIIGAVTVAAFVVASLLRRRGLASTAEGIAAFAVVLVYLDAFAVRANNLFGAQEADPLGYWGATLTVSAVGFSLWRRVSSLRVANIAAFAAFAPGIGLLAAAVAGPLEPVTRVWVFFTAVGLAGLVHPFARVGAATSGARAERLIALGFAVVALPVSFALALVVTPDVDAAAPLALVAVAVVAGAHVAVLLREPAETLTRIMATTFSVIAALSLTVAIALLGYRILPFEVAIAVSPAAVLVVALFLVAVSARTPSAHRRLAARGASIAAGAVAAATLSLPLAAATLAAAILPLSGLLLEPWQNGAFDTVAEVSPENVGAVFALWLTVLIAWAFHTLTGLVRGARAVLPWSLSTVLVLSVPLLGVLSVIVLAWLLLAAAAVAALVAARRRPLPLGRAPLATLAVVAASLAYASAWASTDLWLPVSIAVAALLIAARPALPPESREVRAALLGVATLVAVVAAAALGRRAGLAPTGLPGDGDAPLFDSLRAVSILAVALLALAAVPAGRAVSDLDRRAVFFIGLPLAATAIPFAGVMLAIDRGLEPSLVEPVTSLLLALALLAALAAWLAFRANAAFTAQRFVAEVAVAPALFWALDSLARVLELRTEVAQLSAIAASLLVAAGSLVVAVRRPASSRDGADIGTAVVAACGTVVVVVSGSPSAWLALVLTATTVLLLATSRDGLIGSKSGRRHAAWAALALATAGFWWRLQTASVAAVEAYSLPLAGVLLLVAALVWRSARTRETTDATGAVIALAGLLVAVVPSALSSWSSAGSGSESGAGDPARAVVVFAVSAVLLLGGSLVRARVAARPYLDASAAAGLVGVVLAAVGQQVNLADAQPDLGLDAWTGAVFLVLVVAAIGQCAPRPGDRELTPHFARALVVTAMVLVLVAEGTAFDSSDLAFARAVAVVALFSAVHVAGLMGRLPFDASTGVVAIVFAGVVGIVAVGGATVDAVEWVSVPIAVALLVTGGSRLARTPALRSWPALGAGLGVLLVPSLLATMVDRPVWRLVAIGVVALAVFVLGFVRRLQAAFLIGGVVALVHGIATFSPQLRDVYQLTEWWVWAGAGGVVIIVLGARYERSLNSAKSIVLGIGALR